MSLSSAQVRRAFLDYFGRNDHEVVQSGPVVVPNDPTLMFANAGMVQFKDVFTGKEQRPYKRATTSQKCIRISGKHNDLENVGPSPRHHTFFEMLGNFSFGDYFKEQAIVLAWGFIRELGLDPDRLVFTYFKGENGIPADLEAKELWKKVSGVSEDRIIGCGMADNFWSMGDTGPCGPCSEIHFYQGPRPDVSEFGQEQTPEGFGWIEIWNLVFMQFNRDAGGTLAPLPAPSIDTGMGLERIVAVVQGKTSNYETDLLRALVDKAAQISGKSYGGSMSPDDVSMRVIADHSRLTAFLLAEGVMPDTNGRQYVLRRVMRRAIRHGHRLGIEKPFLHDVALRVTELMGEQYPELMERADHVARVCEQEEVRFRRTIERGLALLDERFDSLQEQGSKVLDGADAFKLYDTYGFPLDLTEVICRERGLDVDVAGYEQALEQARQRSKFEGLEQAIDNVYRAALERVPGESVKFSGYERDVDRGTLLAIAAGGRLVESVSGAAEPLEELELVFDRTPFYGESGGQVGDTGKVVAIAEAGAENSLTFEVLDTLRPLPGLVVHKGRLVRGELRLGDSLQLQIDVARRSAIRRNHSATHLLHWALRSVLGSHVQQKGSLVGPDRLRFDFTHGQPLSGEEIERIEDLVNERILRNVPIQTELLPIERAKERGAMMLFGEKYGETVRVLSMTESVELCGGTHARATGDIGMLKITAEQGVAAGVRRITATTGEGTVAYLREVEGTLNRAAELSKAGNDLTGRIEKLLANEKALEKKVQELQKKLLSGTGGGIESLLSQARDVRGVKALAVRTEISDRGALREMAEQLRDRLGNSIVLVASEAEGKAQMVLTVSKDLTGTFKAGQLIRPLAAIVGGSGGGRPDLAQAGGTEVDKLDQALSALYRELEPEQLSLV
jgi:alanyl-tRNA synthetase